MSFSLESRRDMVFACGCLYLAAYHLLASADLREERACNPRVESNAAAMRTCQWTLECRHAPAHQPSVEHRCATAKAQASWQLFLGRRHASADAVVHDLPNLHQLHSYG